MTCSPYAIFYRALMKLAHRYGWHYAPLKGPMDDGSTYRWCQWCGFRESYRHVNYSALIGMKQAEEPCSRTILGRKEPL